MNFSLKTIVESWRTYSLLLIAIIAGAVLISFKSISPSYLEWQVLSTIASI